MELSTSGIEFANFPRRALMFCLTSIESYLDLSAQDLEFGFNETTRNRFIRTFVHSMYHYHLNEIFAVLKVKQNNLFICLSANYFIFQNEYTDWENDRSPFSSRDAALAFLSDGHTASSLVKLGYMHSLRGGPSYFLHFKYKTVAEEYPQVSTLNFVYYKKFLFKLYQCYFTENWICLGRFAILVWIAFVTLISPQLYSSGKIHK